MSGVLLDSVSPKYSMYAETVGQLQERGVGRRTALFLMANQTTVSLSGEWVEAFWCSDCHQTDWYHIQRLEHNAYQVQLAPADLWQQVQGVIDPQGNPSVSEFTKKAARMSKHQSVCQNRFFE
jgi:hypothetical protein